MVTIGTWPGMYFSRKFVDWTGRRSVTVAILLFFIVFSTVANPAISISVLIMMKNEGKDVMKFGNYC